MNATAGLFRKKAIITEKVDDDIKICVSGVLQGASLLAVGFRVMQFD